MRALTLALLAALSLSACTELQVGSHIFKRANAAGGCKTQGDIKVGNAYTVDSIRYQPMVSSLGYREKGIASWYGSDFHGKASANGECYNMYAYTAAHKTLPLPTIVRVTNLENNKSVVVKVNDRGPFVRGRIIDLSYAAAQSLDIVRYGTAPVLVEAIGGPHNQVGGYQGGGTQIAQKLGPRDEVAETLPSTVPATASEEDLAPQSIPQPNPALATAKERKLGVPPPTTDLPPPPPEEDRVVTDAEPLKHTRVYVQIGAYSNASGADAQKAKLAQLYPTTTAIMPLQLNGKTLLRVRAGPFQSIADADAALAKVVAAGFNGAQIKVED
jgi:rare lipoprotein A